ncbi:MAG TPA: hypothetical protein VN937_14570 [Blastocatellia bacterium]|nr:hypothetical protein [Blastocatellia bacterium]
MEDIPTDHTRPPSELRPCDTDLGTSGRIPPPMAPEKPKKKTPWYNQPLWVGIFILIGTFAIQQWGWKDQQKFIAQQSKVTATVARAEATTEQVTQAVGKALTASASIVGAHEARVNKSQLNEAIDSYHQLLREWDQSEDLLKLRIRTSFPVPPIESAWTSLLDQLGELDSEVTRLDKFNTTDTSDAHLQQIDHCRKIIKDIEQQLTVVTHLMTEHINATLTDQK